MRWLNTDPLFVPHLADILKITPTLSAVQISEFDHVSPIAGVLYDGYNGKSVHAHIWIAPGRLPSRVWWWAICDYAFKQLGVDNVIGTVPESNTEAARLDEKLGFRLVGRIEDYYPDGDAVLMYVCTHKTVFNYERFRPPMAVAA
jgi:hypothetical protein